MKLSMLELWRHVRFPVLLIGLVLSFANDAIAQQIPAGPVPPPGFSNCLLSQVDWEANQYRTVWEQVAFVGMPPVLQIVGPPNTVVLSQQPITGGYSSFPLTVGYLN